MLRVERVERVELNLFPLSASLGPVFELPVLLRASTLRQSLWLYVNSFAMEQESNIRTLFVAARNQRKQLETSTDPTSALYQENLQSAIAALEGCKKIADRISLFSQNETEEDIASGDLQ